MDRGTWQATVHGVARVGHNLGTKPPLPTTVNIFSGLFAICVLSLVICLFVTFARSVIGLFGGFFTVEC